MNKGQRIHSIFYDDIIEPIRTSRRPTLLKRLWSRRKSKMQIVLDRLKNAEDRVKSLEEAINGKPSTDLMSTYLTTWRPITPVEHVTKRLDKIEAAMKCAKCEGRGSKTRKCGCSGGLRKCR